VVSVAADGVSSKKIWSAAASSGSGKPGHTEFTDDGCQGKGWSCCISSELTIGVRYRSCFTVFQMKTEQNSCIIGKFNAILGVLTIYAN